MTVIQVRTAEQHQAVRMIRERVFVEEQGVPRHLEYDTHDETAIHLLVLDERVDRSQRDVPVHMTTNG